MICIKPVISFLFLIFAFSFSCSTTTPKKGSNLSVRINSDSLFIVNQLPIIRDAYCSGSLSLQYLTTIFRGRIIEGKFGIEMYLDSTDSIGADNHTRADVSLDSSRKVTSINILFPRFFIHKSIFVTNDQMISIFGKYSPSPLPKIKDGYRGDYTFGKDCHPQKEVSAHFNIDNSVRTVYMSTAFTLDSSGNPKDSEGRILKP